MEILPHQTNRLFQLKELLANKTLIASLKSIQLVKIDKYLIEFIFIKNSNLKAPFPFAVNASKMEISSVYSLKATSFPLHSP